MSSKLSRASDMDFFWRKWRLCLSCTKAKHVTLVAPTILQSVWPGHKWHKPCCRSIWAIWAQSTLMDFDFVQSTRAICINLHQFVSFCFIMFHHVSSLLRSLRHHPQGHWKPKPNPAQLALRCFQGARNRARNPQAGGIRNFLNTKACIKKFFAWV